MTLEIIAEVEQLANNGTNEGEISKLVGLSVRRIRKILRGDHSLQTGVTTPSRAELTRKSRAAVVAVVGERQTGGQFNGRAVKFLPTPDQIEAACRAIRTTWADTDLRQRRWPMPDAETA